MKTIYFILVVLLCPAFIAYGQQIELVKDINPTGDGNPSGFTILGDKMYFFAEDGEHGKELWVTDGTTDGTMMVKDIHSGSSGSVPIGYYYDGFVKFNDEIYFGARDSINGRELWKSDGTAEGTVMVKDINPGGGASSPINFIVFNNKIYFSAGHENHGRELWGSDGTAEGTLLVKDIKPGETGSRAGEYSGFHELNGKFYFTANDGVHGDEVWASDGTPENTHLLKNIYPDTIYPYYYHIWLGPWGYKKYNDKLYFTALDGSHGPELWTTDGTEEGTYMVKDIYPGSDGSLHYTSFAFYEFNNKLYFGVMAGVSSNIGIIPKRGICVTDGTAEGTEVLKIFEISQTQYYHDGIDELLEFNGKLYFNADDGIHGEELWVTDGTEEGTHMVKDLDPGTNSSWPGTFRVLNNKLYFLAEKEGEGRHLWVTDGTESGTHSTTPNTYDPNYSEVADLFVFQNSLFLRARYKSNVGYELYKYTPDSISNVAENTVIDFTLYPNPTSSYVHVEGIHPKDQITLTDITGKTLFTQEVNGAQNHHTISTENFASGLYFITIKRGENASVKKLVLH